MGIQKNVVHDGHLTSSVMRVIMNKSAVIELVRRQAGTAPPALPAPINFGWLGGAPNFFPAAAAPHVSSWRRRRNSAAEGSSAWLSLEIGVWVAKKRSTLVKYKTSQLSFMGQPNYQG